VETISVIERHVASFRDPAGFVFEHEGDIFRAVHPDASGDVDLLFRSGLHDELVEGGLLVPHRARPDRAELLPEGWTLLQADRLPVISYASEWTDSQLQRAGMVTLDVQRRALKHGMSLKDASAFNVQFHGARPVFIDVLSLTRLESSRPWPAYRQFCEHFVAPLALRRYLRGSVGGGISLDGVPLATASRMLPARTWMRPPLALHLHMHARASIAGGPHFGSTTGQDGNPSAIIAFRLQLAASLQGALQGSRASQPDSHWVDYRNNNVYSATSAVEKRRFVEQAARISGASRALDLGANDGHYARVLAEAGVACTAVEMDEGCCERVYSTSLAPPYDRLVNTMRVDLTNPTPAHGWAHHERASFAERMRCDLTLCLALLHHLSITHHVPFDRIAAFLAELAPNAVVEYVPPSDPMVQQLLAARTGLTESYLDTLSQSSFLRAFEARFECLDHSAPLEGRVLYHFRRRCE